MNPFVFAGLFLAALFIGFCLNITIHKLLASPPKPRPSWTVEVISATRITHNYAGTRWSTPEPVQGETAVNLVRGKEKHPIGTVKVTAGSFTEELERLKGIAEDRASTLNAIETL